jgi:hypothetical protein
VERGSFVDTRVRAMDSLKAALAGDTACQKAVFEEPLKSQLRTILEENGHWQTAMYDKLTDLDGNENNRSSKRARR